MAQIESICDGEWGQCDEWHSAAWNLHAYIILVHVQIERRSVGPEEPQISARVLTRASAEQNELCGIAESKAADGAVNKMRE